MGLPFVKEDSVCLRISVASEMTQPFAMAIYDLLLANYAENLNKQACLCTLQTQPFYSCHSTLNMCL